MLLRNNKIIGIIINYLISKIFVFQLSHLTSVNLYLNAYVFVHRNLCFRFSSFKLHKAIFKITKI